MKTIKINSLLSLLLLATMTLFTSCVGEDDYADLNFEANEPQINGNIVELSAVYGQLEQNDFELQTFTGTNNYAVGYVVSSDIGGNFFRELVIQDRPENPTVGLSIQIDKAPLFTIFEVGQKVFIKLDGLSIGQDVDNPSDLESGEFGVAELGFDDGGQVGQIGESFFDEHIIRSPEVVSITPTVVQPGSLSPALLNTAVTFENVQFLREYLTFQGENIVSSISYASESDDQFDGERILESCDNGNQIILSTSTFSDFKALSLPQGSGRISGVLTRTFEGDKYTFYLISPRGTDMTEERCDPLVFSCGTTTPAANNFIDLDFEGEGTGSVNVAGWTNYIQSGSVDWETYSAGGTNASLGTSARIGSFSSGDDSSIAWLISPEIPITSNSKVTLEFQTSNSFSDDSTLQLLFSENWDGTEAGVATAEWGLIDDAIIVSDGEFFGNWVESGVVDMSCFAADGHFAFRYAGSGAAGQDGTYELDEILVNVE